MQRLELLQTHGPQPFACQFGQGGRAEHPEPDHDDVDVDPRANALHRAIIGHRRNDGATPRADDCPDRPDRPDRPRGALDSGFRRGLASTTLYMNGRLCDVAQTSQAWPCQPGA